MLASKGCAIICANQEVAISGWPCGALLKSRRKAPIYWLLQSARKNYALWIYFHRLERDTLNKALVNYVEPKLRLENNRLQELRGKVTEVGTTGSAARDLDRKIERQEELISELDDFQENSDAPPISNLEPDLNDGVVLNIAALWNWCPGKRPRSIGRAAEWQVRVVRHRQSSLKAQGLVSGKITLPSENPCFNIGRILK